MSEANIIAALMVFFLIAFAVMAFLWSVKADAYAELKREHEETDAAYMRYCDNVRPYIRQLRSLIWRGWRLKNVDDDDLWFWRLSAPDEPDSNHLLTEAYERQQELDKIKRLNLPKEPKVDVEPRRLQEQFLIPMHITESGERVIRLENVSMPYSFFNHLHSLARVEIGSNVIIEGDAVLDMRDTVNEPQPLPEDNQFVAFKENLPALNLLKAPVESEDFEATYGMEEPPPDFTDYAPYGWKEDDLNG